MTDAGTKAPTRKTVDGNWAASNVAYELSDVVMIYPITPSSNMGENADEWASEGRRNAFGNVVDIHEMQSEAGVSGALHGALVGGTLASTFTASQGLLLMMPNMFKIAGEMLPCVLHISARAVAGQALSIFGDHSDVMACRQTGWGMLASSSPQEAQDMALVAHMATVKTTIPFMHFFDGFRTSHELQTIELLTQEQIKSLIDKEAIDAFIAKGLNPEHPQMRGTSQGPDIYMQLVEATEKYYARAPALIAEVMAQVSKLCGREYHLFDYVGHAEAERVIVIMCSGADVVEDAVKYLVRKGEKVGMIKVRLYRPFSAKHFLDVLPKTVKSIAVCDRTKEPGATGCPMYLDVVDVCQHRNLKIIGGRYGLGSKEFTPGMAISIFKELNKEKSLNGFTVGIDDDVMHTSLAVDEEPNCVPDGVTQALFWGLGADGTVGANKNAMKIIGDKAKQWVQGYFAYDAKKSGGVTISHLRFGPSRLDSHYLVNSANYIGCHFPNYVRSMDLMEQMQVGGVFVLNSPWTAFKDLERELPDSLKAGIAQKKVKFYNIDAISIAVKAGLGRRINNVMQLCFFKLSGILPVEVALEEMRAAIVKTYGAKGDAIVKSNMDALDATLAGLQEINYPASWATLEPKGISGERTFDNEFYLKVMKPVSQMQGNKIPVSDLKETGVMPVGTSAMEKRMVSSSIPVWNPDSCTQCNECSLVCPHAAIRPFVLSPEEAAKAPASFKMVDYQDKEGYKYRIQVDPYDCIGCNACIVGCPSLPVSLKEAAIADAFPAEGPNWDFAETVSEKHFGDSRSIKGSQLFKPLLEFSGACAGCGETPYVKLVTQLFGSRMMVANATGCSSIWGGSAPICPYTTDESGHGPAWANSLFEDNAEYGYGMAAAMIKRREDLHRDVEALLESKAVPEVLVGPLKEWLPVYLLGPESEKASFAIKKVFETISAEEKKKLATIGERLDLFTKKSQWIIGGDGWAYDIGYGGLDHVLAMGLDVNILVLDTEVYSNTGGQRSKATPIGGIAKFSAAGKRTGKKDLGALAMTYGNVYVASVAMGANRQQLLRAFNDAERYPGPSLIVAYGPCIAHGVKGGLVNAQAEEKLAVDTGYWLLYRYDPTRLEKGRNPLVLDSGKPTLEVQTMLDNESRFAALKRSHPEDAKRLQKALADSLRTRYENYVLMAADGAKKRGKAAPASAASGEEDVAVIFGSQTGNARRVANELVEMMLDEGFNADIHNPTDMDFEKILSVPVWVVVCATAGEGQFPDNFEPFWKWLSGDHPEDKLAKVSYAVFGMGSMAYAKWFQFAAKKTDKRLEELGAKRFMDGGFGDDLEEDGYRTGLEPWVDSLLEKKLPAVAKKAAGPVSRAAPIVDIEEVAGCASRRRQREIKFSDLETRDEWTNKIIEKMDISADIKGFRIICPHVAKFCSAGQFVIVRTNERDERVPLTIADFNESEGFIVLVIQNVGFSSAKINRMNVGDKFLDIMGPLGEKSEIENFGTVVTVSGGLGVAPVYPIQRALKQAGNKVISIMGARSKDLIFWEDEMRQYADETIVCTDDGSYGKKGFVTVMLQNLIDGGMKIDRVVAIGPPIMMKFVSKVTQPHKIKTIVSLNTVMVDGTGMCAGCRVKIGDDVKYVCVDGPEFDAHQVDWDLMMSRMATYDTQERAQAKFKGRDQEVVPQAAKFRVPIPEQDARFRATNFDEVALGYTESMAVAEAMRCKQCKEPTCISGCPVNVEIKGFIKLVQEKKFLEAAKLIKRTNPVPAICGRVCPQEVQCELVCKLQTEDNLEPVAIGRLERFVADYEAEYGDDVKPETQPSTGKRIAVVGAGPAGIVCASDLASAGHKVTIFEALHGPGGVLIYGIPQFRLPKEIVARECFFIKEMGVEFRFNYPVGKAGSVPQLMRDGYDAVFLGTGAGLPWFIGVPGENLKGVLSSNEFLTRTNLMKAYKFPDHHTPVYHGQKVAVCGGGNVAMDAARCAKRLGAETVYIVYRRTLKEMPARAEELHHAIEEGIIVKELVSPVEIKGNDKGIVRGIELRKMRLGEPDASGRRRPVPTDETFELEIDQFIPAIGQGPNPLLTKEWKELHLDKRGHIPVDENCMTNVPGVFAGGDIVTGAATVILAAGAGKKAAAAIDSFLKKQ